MLLAENVACFSASNIEKLGVAFSASNIEKLGVAWGQGYPFSISIKYLVHFTRQGLTMMIRNTTLEKITPPWAKAYGRDKVPAPIHVVSSMNIDEQTVPWVVSLEAERTFFSPLWFSPSSSSSGECKPWWEERSIYSRYYLMCHTNKHSDMRILT